MTTQGNTFMNAVVGAVVTVVVAFLPLSPTIGGAVSGYLQRGGLREGAKVGGLVGLFAMVPLYVALLVVVPLFVIYPFGVPTLPFDTTLYALGLFVAVGVYTVGLGVLGGVIGAYLAEPPQTGGPAA